MPGHGGERVAPLAPHRYPPHGRYYSQRAIVDIVPVAARQQNEFGFVFNVLA